MAESGADGDATELPAEELPQGGVFVRPRKTKIPVSELLTGIMVFLSNPLAERQALEPIHSRNIIKLQITDNHTQFGIHSKSKSF